MKILYHISRKKKSFLWEVKNSFIYFCSVYKCYTFFGFSLYKPNPTTVKTQTINAKYKNIFGFDVNAPYTRYNAHKDTITGITYLLIKFRSSNFRMIKIYSIYINNIAEVLGLQKIKSHKMALLLSLW